MQIAVRYHTRIVKRDKSWLHFGKKKKRELLKQDSTSGQHAKDKTGIERQNKVSFQFSDVRFDIIRQVNHKRLVRGGDLASRPAEMFVRRRRRLKLKEKGRTRLLRCGRFTRSQTCCTGGRCRPSDLRTRGREEGPLSEKLNASKTLEMSVLLRFLAEWVEWGYATYSNCWNKRLMINRWTGLKIWALSSELRPTGWHHGRRACPPSVQRYLIFMTRTRSSLFALLKDKEKKQQHVRNCDFNTYIREDGEKQTNKQTAEDTSFIRTRRRVPHLVPILLVNKVLRDDWKS